MDGAEENVAWHDPRVFLEPDRTKAGVMHAKVVIIDDQAALVTSANFTAAAQNRNIEAGVLIRHHSKVAQLLFYSTGLIDQPVWQAPELKLDDDRILVLDAD